MVRRPRYRRGSTDEAGSAAAAGDGCRARARGRGGVSSIHPTPTPPHRPDLEAAILGALLLGLAAIADVADVVSAADFYLRRHRLIYRAMLDLDSAGERADIVTIADRLREQGQLGEIGGRDALSELAYASVGEANIRAYAERV